MAQIRYGIDVVGSFQLNGFATGAYCNHCRECGVEFTGDKRAVLCLECAIERVEENFNSTQQLKAEIRAISDIIEVSESGLVTVDFACLKQRLRELSAV